MKLQIYLCCQKLRCLLWSQAPAFHISLFRFLIWLSKAWFVAKENKSQGVASLLAVSLPCDSAQSSQAVLWLLDDIPCRLLHVVSCFDRLQPNPLIPGVDRAGKKSQNPFLRNTGEICELQKWPGAEAVIMKGALEEL